MAAKKKTKEQQKTKSNQTAGRKTTSSKKRAKQKPAAKPGTFKKAVAKKKSAKKKLAVKTKSVGRKVNAKIVGKPKKRAPRKSDVNTMAFPRIGRGVRSGQQSGDLQGLSDIETADSESVDELIEEGNAFEADVVAGVERAGNEEGREVRTHEVPEDDVPDEYLDNE